MREVGAWARGSGLRPGLANGSCSPCAAVGLEDARTWAKVVAFAAPRLPRRGGQAYTAGWGVGGFYAPTAVCTPAGRFCKHLSGSFGIKGIRVMKCILRLQLQPKRNPCYLRAQMYHLFSSDTFIKPFGLKLLSLSQVSRFSLSCCSPIWAFVVSSCSSAEILQAQMGVEWGDGGRGERRKRRIQINPFRSVLLSGYVQSCSDCRGQGLTR